MHNAPQLLPRMKGESFFLLLWLLDCYDGLVRMQLTTVPPVLAQRRELEQEQEQEQVQGRGQHQAL